MISKILFLIAISTVSLASQTTNYNEQSTILKELLAEKVITLQQYEHLIAETRRNTPLKSTKTLGGSAIINGHVQDSTSAPLLNQNVYLYELIANEKNFVDSTQTDSAGNYSFTTLNAGTYLIYVGEQDDDYLNYLWSSAANDICTINKCIIEANNHINLASADTINGIDFVLTTGGMFTGSVSDSVTSLPVDTLSVFVSNTSLNSQYYLSSTFDPASGTFTVKGIPDGTYKVYLEYTSFFDSIENIHIPQIYGGPECNYCYRLLTSGVGTELTITSANTINNIDFSLNVGASISGNLVDNITLNPLPNYSFIFIFDDANSFLGYHVVLGTNNDPLADGSYTMGGLLPGNYYVQGGDAGQDFYQRELYSNKPCYYSSCNRSLGDLVTLGARENKSGINFLLEKGGKISGTITDAITGLPLLLDNANSSVLVEFINSSEQVRGAAFVNPNGTYTAARAMPAGNYSVRTGSMFSGESNQPYLNEKYNNIPCAGRSCDLSTANVAVLNNITTTGIDFALNEGNSFTGTVTDLMSSAPLSGVNVLVYKDMGMGTVKFANWATTGDGSPGSLPVGEFIVSGLDDGTYYARTGYGSDLPFFVSSFINIGGAAPSGWIDILYDGMTCLAGCDVTTGTPITLPTITTKSNSGTPIGPVVNFGLLQGAVITGEVTDFIQKGPLEGIKIEVYNDQGVFMGSSSTDENGNYITRGLPTGTYYLITSSLSALLDVKYGNEFCFSGSCDPLDAQPISVSGTNTTNNKNFILKTSYMHMFSNDFE